MLNRGEFVRLTATLGVASAAGVSLGKGKANMEKAELTALTREDALKLIGKDWMLVTSGKRELFNTMTASWGGIGWLWNRPVAFVFIRPERYTHDFIEREGRLTLSFYDEAHRGILQYCGAKSGRDVDKVKETGLEPVELESGAVTFGQARLTLDCRKLFKSPMTAANFVDKSILAKWYGDKPGMSLHDIYVVEVEQVYAKSL